MLLLAAREYLERALSLARSRADERLIGERICDVMELQELEECRTLAEVRLRGCKHTNTARHRRAERTADGGTIVASDCVECGAFVREAMGPDWDGTVYTWPAGSARPRRMVI